MFFLSFFIVLHGCTDINNIIKNGDEEVTFNDFMVNQEYYYDTNFLGLYHHTISNDRSTNIAEAHPINNLSENYTGISNPADHELPGTSSFLHYSNTKLLPKYISGGNHDTYCVNGLNSEEKVYADLNSQFPIESSICNELLHQQKMCENLYTSQPVHQFPQVQEFNTLESSIFRENSGGTNQTCKTSSSTIISAVDNSNSPLNPINSEEGCTNNQISCNYRSLKKDMFVGGFKGSFSGYICARYCDINSNIHYHDHSDLFIKNSKKHKNCHANMEIRHICDHENTYIYEKVVDIIKIIGKRRTKYCIAELKTFGNTLDEVITEFSDTLSKVGIKCSVVKAIMTRFKTRLLCYYTFVMEYGFDKEFFRNNLIRVTKNWINKCVDVRNKKKIIFQVKRLYKFFVFAAANAVDNHMNN